MSPWYDPITTAMSKLVPTGGEWSGAFGCIITKIESMAQYLQEVSTSLAGLCPKLPNNIHFYLRGDGVWAAPPGTGGIGGVAGSADGEILVADGTAGDTIKGSGLTVEETLTDDDTKIPTSGAVVDAIAAVSGIGGSTGSTDNAVLRANGTGGSTAQSSPVTIDDSGSVNIPSGQSYKKNGVALAAADVGAFASADNITLADGKNVELKKALGTDNTYSGLTATETAGENLAFGDLCYRKSDGKFWKSDSDAASTMPARVMALGSISADATGLFLRFGYVRHDAWTLTAGSPVYPSGTAGGITHTAPSASAAIVQIVGEAISANPDIMFFSPDRTFIELV